MDRTEIPFMNRRWILFYIAFFLLQAGLVPTSFAQSILQQNVIAGVSCSNSNNGTGHVLCLEEINNPGGNGPILGRVSWQAPNSPSPPPGSGIESAFKVDQDPPDLTMPSGPFTGAPGCANTSDGSGTVICAIEGSNNGLYGIAIHPQPLATGQGPQETLLVPLLTPGQVLTNFKGNPPCTPNPCTRVGAIAGIPSCAVAEGGMVICAAIVLLQNTIGSTSNVLVGIAFDPRAPVTSTNPVTLGLVDGSNFYSDPSCASSKDPSGVLNNGKTFAICAISFSPGFFGGTPTLFGAAFDPRSGYNAGSLNISSSTGFSLDPSCATPHENKGTVICAMGAGLGNGFGTGTASTMLGFAFDNLGRTTSTMNLGAPPAGDGAWKGVGCASPVDAKDNNSVACAAVTSTNQILAINFDPRTGLDPVTNAAPAFRPVTFNDPNGAGATFVSAPSCVPENIINNQITCVIVDSFGDSVGFSAQF